MLTVLPKSFRDSLGSSSILTPLRDWFFRPKGIPDIVGGKIEFCGNVFHFHAPLQIYEHAKRSGIEAKICRLILRNGKPGGVYFDIGANYGFLTLIMAITAGSDGKVYSFEPVENINIVLAGNVQVNKLDGFVTVVDMPVTDRSDVTWESTPDRNGLSTSKTVTIDGYVQKEKILDVDLIKVDVDGGDYQVLLGGRETIERCHPILIVEMMEHQEEIYQYLVDAKYRYICDMKGSMVVPPLWPPNIIASNSVLSWD